jgi:hypothetical protein
MAGIDSKYQDISLLLKDLLASGYTSAKFGTATDVEQEAGFNLTSLPLISQPEPEPTEELQPEPASVTPAATVVAIQAEPEPILIATQPGPEPAPAPEALTTEPEPEAVTELAPSQLVFRVQLLSNSKAGSTPKVTIAGTTYNTWEYYYKGAYRITAGEFLTLDEALDFRNQCKSSGFDQCFVAAFRGNERETDPSVFKR